MNQYQSLESSFCSVRDKIKTAERSYHRKLNSVKLVAVSKGQSFQIMKSLYQFGQQQFAENYVQEALPKILQADEHHFPWIWHFIGRLQSNKLKAIAVHFNWVQSLNSFHHAEKLSYFRPEMSPPLNCCLQITLPSKGPMTHQALNTLLVLAKHVIKYKNLNLRGIMCMIPPCNTTDQQREYFAHCRLAFEFLKNTLPFLDTLSIGMSNDFEAAIAEGSTMVRIGTAIFGPRPSPLSNTGQFKRD